MRQAPRRHPRHPAQTHRTLQHHQGTHHLVKRKGRPLHSYLNASGHWQPCPGLPPSDRGFRHGLSVFETIALRHGRLLFLDEHLDRLRQAAALTGFRPLPDQLAATFPAILATLPADLLDSGIARLYLTAGDGDHLAPYDQGRLLLLLEPRTVTPDAPALRLRLHPTPFNPVWPGLKTGNYWENLRAWREARSLGFDEAVLVNAGGHIVSACLGNLFAVIDGLLLTPRQASGARRGVLRDWVADHTDLIVADFHPEQLRTATEIFLTNSLQGIRPVAAFDSLPLPAQTLARQLQTDYRAVLE